MSVLNLADKFVKLSEGFRTLYHISRHGPAKPVPRMPKREKEYLFEGDEGWEEAYPKGSYMRKRNIKQKPKEIGWKRPWLEEKVESGVFLTPNPIEVAEHHGRITGNIHVYDVAESIIRQSGGIHKFDRASEILIPENVWNKGIHDGLIIYKGSMGSSKFKEMLEESGHDHERENIRSVENDNEFVNFKKILSDLRLKNIISLEDTIKFSRLYKENKYEAFKQLSALTG